MSGSTVQTASSSAISAPGPFLFSVLHASFTTVALTLFVFPVAIGAKTSLKPSVLAFVIVPPILLAAASFIGKADSFGKLLLRSVGVHAVAMTIATIGMSIGRMNDPGATAHGGIVLMIIILVPMACVIGTVFALLGSTLAFVVMRAMRRR